MVFPVATDFDHGTYHSVAHHPARLSEFL